MARIKRAVNAVKKRRKVFKLSKGYYGAKSKQYRAASQQVMRSMAYAYVDVNRKVLADLAVNDMAAFKKLADIAVEARA